LPLQLSQGVLLLASAALVVCVNPGGATTPTLEPVGPLVAAEVTRVIDGNTLDARVEGNRAAVAYLGAASPPANEPCGAMALERNRELAGTSVQLEADRAYGLDDAGRRLFYAYTPEGTSIDATLIAEGLARAVRVDGLHGETLAALEEDARAAGVGCLWKANDS
jgi:endonuclease YncB( thermonuclease family)